RAGVEVGAEQGPAAPGQLAGEFAVGAADFPAAFEQRSRQRGQQQVALAGFVPAAAVAERVVALLPHLFEVARQGHRSYTSNGRSKRSTTCGGRMGAGAPGPPRSGCVAKQAMARRLRASVAGGSGMRIAANGGGEASGGSQCQAQTG